MKRLQNLNTNIGTTTATVLNIQRMSTEDGPGLRTTVFFKGCGLRCAWCHNPESISPYPEVQWLEARCIGCGTCVKACPLGAVAADGRGIHIDRSLCDGCGACARECPATAMELLGEEWSMDRLVAEVVKDRSYILNSDGGGITASGGDPLVQAPFVAEFFRRCREEGFHTALDTCGFIGTPSLERVMPHTDLVLFDLKLSDGAGHKLHTGHSNSKILENLVHVRDYIESHERPELWIRTPVIPGATDTEENIAALAHVIEGLLNGAVSRWELCAFNNLCRDKYRRLGIEWEYRDAQLLDAALMERLANVARDSVTRPEIVRWSGATAGEQAAGDGQREKKTAATHLVKGCG